MTNDLTDFLNESEPVLMTPEKLRTYPGLENLSDERAEKIISTLYRLVAIYFDTYPIIDKYCDENGIGISENDKTPS